MMKRAARNAIEQSINEQIDKLTMNTTLTAPIVLDAWSEPCCSKDFVAFFPKII
jgi:hypothetical protein